jgi:hypothetical protein
LQGSSFKHLTHRSRLTTNAYYARVSPHLLLPDRLLSFRGYALRWATSRTHFLQHFQIGTAPSGFSAPLPDILVAALRGYPWKITRVSDHLRQLFSCGIGLHWWWHWLLGLCLYPTCEASSILNHPIRTSHTPHHSASLSLFICLSPSQALQLASLLI